MNVLTIYVNKYEINTGCTLTLCVMLKGYSK